MSVKQIKPFMTNVFLNAENKMYRVASCFNRLIELKQKMWILLECVTNIFFFLTSVHTEMCCPKGKCGCQYFILLTLKKNNSWIQGSWIFFNKKLILDYYFCLKSGPVFLFKNFIIASPLPRDKKLYHL
jgi:hypothetical protein